MKEQGNNYSAIRNYVRPVISFYKINDIILNTTKIDKFIPSKTRVKKNRGYSYEEIQRLLNIADERMKAVILLMVSSGLRVGALPALHIRDLEKKGDIYKITVYENEQEEYYNFCTVETAQALDAYLSMRSRYEERIIPDSPLIREQFNIRDQFAALSPKKVKAANLPHKIAELAESAGIREKK